MATATLPLSHAHHAANRQTLDTSLDEFDHTEDAPFQANGGSLSRAGSAMDWDEEVVPALKKKLEADSSDLERRIQDTNFERARQHSSRPRPVPRRNMHDEIIQDGLGSDELIPSEWATGSRARFLTASRPPDHASQFRRYDTVRSTSDTYSPYNRSMGDSPSRISSTWETPERASHMFHTASAHSPSPDDSPSSVVHARERARRLARARDQLSKSPSPLESHWEAEEEHTRSVDSSGRVRTLSTPESHVRPGRDGGGGESKRMRKMGSKGSMHDGRATPSRIPLPVSGSMNKVAVSPRRSGASPHLRATKSNDVLESVGTPPHPDGVEQLPPLLPSDAASRSMRATSNKTKRSASAERRAVKKYGALQNSPPTQDVLDEFGPLGGSPRNRQDQMKSGTDEFGVSRSTSNPWDEELLPTVKRRLAQQAMQQNDPRFSRVEGLIDTWDRNGMPLSTRSINSRRHDTTTGIDDDERKDEEGGRQSEGQERGRVQLQNLSPEQQQQNMRLNRLTEQLGMGISHGTTGQNKTMEMKELRHSRSVRRQDDQHVNAQTDGRTYTTPNARPQTMPSANKDSAEDDGAGCCKCTIM